MRSALGLFLIFFAHAACAQIGPAGDPSRGELLYSTHCAACHSAEVHWRVKKRVSDWPSLVAEVRHWEGFNGLRWDDTDVVAVARYLNAAHYHYPEPD